MASAVKDVAVTTSAVSLIAANRRRIALILQNISTTITCVIGIDNTVTSATTATAGIHLLPGEKFIIAFEGDTFQYLYRGAFFGITASGTANIRVMELEDY